MNYLPSYLNLLGLTCFNRPSISSIKNNLTTCELILHSCQNDVHPRSYSLRQRNIPAVKLG
ncbi:hypothetical protein BLOT_004561 [Blomia tropicalis]|nr:hypothetical protein BLOT_004561 [Blomia tropicalis]